MPLTALMKINAPPLAALAYSKGKERAIMKTHTQQLIDAAIAKHGKAIVSVTVLEATLQANDKLRALVKELQKTLQNVKNYDEAIKPKYQMARSLMSEIDAALAKARQQA